MHIKAMHSPDPYVYNVYLYLEKHFPGCVQLVNKTLYRKDGTKKLKLDVVTKRQIIEVKKKNVDIDQCKRQMEYAKEHNLEYTCLVVETSGLECKRYKKFNVTNNLDDLIKKEKKK